MHLETRVLVTGGAGFLGSHLCDRLLKSGAGVLCVDNYFTGSRRNIDHLLDHHGFELIRHDVTFPLYVEVDQIFNLACPASPIHYQHDPVQTTKTSVHGAINMLGLAKRLRAKILQASTSEVYGDPQVHPPHMHPNDGRVVSNFIVQALLGRDITIFGDGQQTRSFCYVDDMIDALVRLMGTADDVTGPINIGNPDEFTMLELASMVIELTASRSRIVHRPLPQDDPRQRRPDISKANDVLGWAPQTALQDGLKRTIAYFEGLLRDDAVRPLIAHEAHSAEA